VQFVAAPAPRIRIEADYQLKNTGNQPLTVSRSDCGARFHYGNLDDWDGAASRCTLCGQSKDSLASFSQLGRFGTPYYASIFLTNLQPAEPGENALGFAEDAFFLPARLSPELLPARGAFATGGVPPKEMGIDARVPEAS